MRRILLLCLTAVGLVLCASASFAEPAEFKMLSAINHIREKNSVAPMALSGEATRVAKYKCAEMERLNYSSHFSPSYGSPADMLNLFSVPFNAVGENTFTGRNSIEEILDSWLSSPAYLKNILDPSFTEAGMGCVSDEKGNSYWVALFIY